MSEGGDPWGGLLYDTKLARERTLEGVVVTWDDRPTASFDLEHDLLIAAVASFPVALPLVFCGCVIGVPFDSPVLSLSFATLGFVAPFVVGGLLTVMRHVRTNISRPRALRIRAVGLSLGDAAVPWAEVQPARVRPVDGMNDQVWCGDWCIARSLWTHDAEILAATIEYHRPVDIGTEDPDALRALEDLRGRDG